MLNIKGIGKRLLTRNGILKISCFLSVFIGTMLIIEMFNLSLSATRSYENDMKLLYGDCDVAVFYSDYKYIDKKTEEEIITLDSVEKVGTLVYSGDIIINGVNLYTIGTDNSSMVRSRYHFSSQLEDGEIAINRVFADVYGYEPGSIILTENQKLTVVEVFEDETLSESGIEMMVTNKNTLAQISPAVGDTNIIMLRLKDIENSHIESEIRGIDDSLSVLIFGTDEEYLSNVNSFKVFVMIVAGCVILVTGLFTATVFKYFVFKYRHDMAVLRMAGATQGQVNTIFRYMTRVITIGGAVGGFLAAIVFNNVFMSELNQKLKLIDGDVIFMFQESLVISVGICLLIQMVLYVMIRFSSKVLPIESLRENEKSNSGKIRKKRRIGYRFIKQDLFIAFKLIQSRLRENSLMIATVSMLVAVSILGPSLSYIIKANGEKYYSNVYLTEFVLTSSNSLSFAEADLLYEDLCKNPEWMVSCMYNASYTAQVGEAPVQYGMSDLNALADLEIISSRGFGENDVIISRSFADRMQYELGDIIQVTTPKIYARDKNGVTLESVDSMGEKLNFRVALIATDNILQNNDILFDIKQEDLINDSVWLERMYIDGDKDIIEQQLNELKGKYSTIKWTNYTDTIVTNNEKIDSRYAVLDFVVKVMVFIAMLGWINSLRNILLSRTKDYDIIRMQGVGKSRIIKIMVYQIAIYILAGLIIGIFLGVFLLEILMYMEQQSFIFQFDFEMVGQILCTMLLFCVILIPTIRKLSSKEFY